MVLGLGGDPRRDRVVGFVPKNQAPAVGILALAARMGTALHHRARVTASDLKAIPRPSGAIKNHRGTPTGSETGALPLLTYETDSRCRKQTAGEGGPVELQA